MRAKPIDPVAVTSCAKSVLVRKVPRADADRCIATWHYSGRPYTKSVHHYGCLLDGHLIGALQFGDPLDINKAMALFRACERDEVMELNRMALSPSAPRNTASRVLRVSLRLLAAALPRLQWVLSYSDATQCGDGACYRGAGFLLTGIRRNSTLWMAPDGRVVSDVGIRTSLALRNRYRCGTSRSSFVAAGLELLPGYQLRYLAPLRRGARERIIAQPIPYSDVPDDARMYCGQRFARPAAGGSAGPPQKGVRTDRRAPNHVPHQTVLFPAAETDR